MTRNQDIRRGQALHWLCNSSDATHQMCAALHEANRTLQRVAGPVAISSLVRLVIYQTARMRDER